MNKFKKFSRNEKIILLLNCIYSILGIFINVFFVAKLMAFTNDNLKTICIYFLTAFLTRTIGSFGLGALLKTLPEKTTDIFRWGFSIRAIFILLILVLKETMPYYFLIMGILFALSEMCYHFANDSLTIDLTNIENRSLYVNTRNLLCNTLGIIIPYLLGTYMSSKSFNAAGQFIFYLSIIAIFICNFIKIKVDEDNFYDYENEENNRRDSFMPIQFINRVHLDKLSLVSEFLFSSLLYGIFENCFQILILYALYLSFNEMRTFGLIYSIFSFLGVVAVYIYNKFHKSKENKFIIMSTVCIFICLMCLIYNYTSPIGAIILGIAFQMANTVIGSLYSTVKGNVSNNYNLKNFSSEYMTFLTLYQNFGRVIGFLIILVASILKLKIVFKIAMIILSLCGIISAFVMNYINGEIGSERSKK